MYIIARVHFESNINHAACQLASCRYYTLVHDWNILRCSDFPARPTNNSFQHRVRANTNLT